MANDDDTAADARRVSTLSSICNEMVRLYKEQFGRGPTRARTHWSGEDVLITVLKDTFTPAERNLARMHEHQRLRETRGFFQYATVREFCESVERLTGRKGRAFVSGIDTTVDGLSIESFILHPVGYDGPSRIALDAEDRQGGRLDPLGQQCALRFRDSPR